MLWAITYCNELIWCDSVSVYFITCNTMLASFKEQITWAKGLIDNNSAITVGASQKWDPYCLLRLGLIKCTHRRECKWNRCWQRGAATVWFPLSTSSFCRVWQVRLLISPPYPYSSPLRKSRRQGGMELGQDVVWFYVHSFFIFHSTNMWVCPFYPLAMHGNLSVTAWAGPSAACLSHPLEDKTFTWVFENQ